MTFEHPAWASLCTGPRISSGETNWPFLTFTARLSAPAAVVLDGAPDGQPEVERFQDAGASDDGERAPGADGDGSCAADSGHAGSYAHAPAHRSADGLSESALAERPAAIRSEPIRWR